VAERDDVRRLVVGTAAIGLPYGLPAPGAAAPLLIDRTVATTLIDAAASAGVGAFDTAPAYGEAEMRLGAALGARGRVWTKLASAPAGVDLPDHIDRSLTHSCAALRRSRLDLVQWHNWTRALAHDATWRGCWRALGDDPRVAQLGASTYGVDDAVAAVASGLFTVVQVEFNLLNQAVVAAIADAARAAGVAIAVRSVLLQGVLTDRATALPPHLAALAEPAARARRIAESHRLDLATMAIRAALDHPAVSWVLIGLDGRAQLDQALAAARAAPLDTARRRQLAALDLGGVAITDPRTWRAA